MRIALVNNLLIAKIKELNKIQIEYIWRCENSKN